MEKALTIYTCQLTAEEAVELKEYLEEEGYAFRTVPHAAFAAEKEKFHVVFYQSGKLVLQGKGTQNFLEFVLEPLILKKVEYGYEKELHPERFLPRIGVDESGKGDFFGPLCIAGVYVNESVLDRWKNEGVRDSKSISSDRQIAALAERIRTTPGCFVSVVAIGNEAYNRLHKKFGSVNRLLAWGHARVIENLLDLGDKLNPPPVKAISDQFAADKNTVLSALQAKGKTLELVQRHRAEEDMAVAAASILARNEFVTRLTHLQKECGMTLPKGASSAVDMAAKQLFEQFGNEALAKVSKMHFRTALRAQNLPEPEKVEWRKMKPKA